VVATVVRGVTLDFRENRPRPGSLTAVPAHRCSGIRCCPRYGENLVRAGIREKCRRPAPEGARKDRAGQPPR